MPEVEIKSIIVFILVLTVVVLSSCNAPRENPLDPNSSDNLLGRIDGTVQTFSLPYTPIGGAEVLWNPGNVFVYTDSSGNFSISNVKTENGLLIFRKEGFHTDTVRVKWNGTKKINEQVNLNRIPALDSLSIYSVVINVADTSSPMYELIVQTKVIDTDNDIDTVFVINNQLGLNKAMDFNVATKTYQSILTLQDLNLNDIEQTIGLQFNFLVKNLVGTEYTLNGGSVTRVIKNKVAGLLPDNNQVIDSFPFSLTWNSPVPLPGYLYHYKIEIYTNDISNPQLVLSKDNISSNDLYYLINTFDPGSYWWVIWIVDDFHNMARSIPATFMVQ